jgi:Na+/H+-translocating membrane pyrophosphatase
MAETRASHAQNAGAQWTGWHTVSLVTIIASIVLAGLLFPARHRLGTWVLILLLLAAFAAVAGQGITGLWSGLLIDETNKISLSRLQMTLWSLVVLSGLLTAALSNVGSGQPNPLVIAVPSELWLLMGISTTSLVASPLIESTRRDQLATAL